MSTALTTFVNKVEDDGEAIPLVELKKFMPFDRYVPTRPGAVPSAPPLETECDALISHIDGSGSVLYVMGAINNFECVSLWDTGANVTLVRHNAAKKAGVAQMYPTKRKGSAANNTRLTFLGEIQADISIGSYTIPGLTILVVPEHDSPSDLLFGTNLFEKFQEKGILTNIDYINKRIIVGKDNLKLVAWVCKGHCQFFSPYDAESH